MFVYMVLLFILLFGCYWSLDFVFVGCLFKVGLYVRLFGLLWFGMYYVMLVGSVFLLVSLVVCGDLLLILGVGFVSCLQVR